LFIIYAVILGITAGYLTGGRLKWMAKHPFKYAWLALLAFLIQIVIFSDFPFMKHTPSLVVIVFHLISYSLLLGFIFLNRFLTGIIITGLGIFLNALVIFINGGYMPTSSQNIQRTSMNYMAEAVSQGSAVHNSMEATKGTLLPWLGDIFYLPSWIPLSNVFSIGDILIAIGIFVYFIYNMKPVKNYNYYNS
jgi:hypothetical protein